MAPELLTILDQDLSIIIYYVILYYIEIRKEEAPSPSGTLTPLALRDTQIHHLQTSQAVDFSPHDPAASQP